MRDSQLLGHSHHSGADQENLDPRELIPAPLDQGRPGIGKDESAGYVQNQDVQETGHVFERAGSRRTMDMRSHSAYESAIRICCHLTFLPAWTRARLK